MRCPLNTSIRRGQPPISKACAALLILLGCAGCGGTVVHELKNPPDTERSTDQLVSRAKDHVREWLEKGRSRAFGLLEQYQVTHRKQAAALLTYARWNATFSFVVEDSQRSINDESHDIVATFVSSRPRLKGVQIPDPTMQRFPYGTLQIDQDPSCILSRSCDPERLTHAITQRLSRLLCPMGPNWKERQSNLDDILQDMKTSFEYLDVYVVTFRRERQDTPGAHVEEFEVIMTPSGRVLGSRITRELIVEHW